MDWVGRKGSREEGGEDMGGRSRGGCCRGGGTRGEGRGIDADTFWQGEGSQGWGDIVVSSDVGDGDMGSTGVERLSRTGLVGGTSADFSGGVWLLIGLNEFRYPSILRGRSR